MKSLRRKRLNDLLMGPRFNGDRSAFLTTSGISKGRLTQLLNPKEPFGDTAAKNLCEALGLPEGWFDSAAQSGGISPDLQQNHALATVSITSDAVNNNASLRPILAWEHLDDLPAGDYVLIPRLDVHLSAGNGCEQVALDLVKDTPQAFRAEWIREMRIKPAKLASMRANGDSMEPRIFDGDAVVVDTGDTTVLDGKVYAVWYDGGERIKRLYRLPGNGLRIASDNANLYPKIDLNEDQSHHVRVLGRVRHVSSTQGL